MSDSSGSGNDTRRASIAPRGGKPLNLRAAAKELDKASRLEEPTERAVAVIAVLRAVLRDLRVDPVIVGGMAVQYWTHGAFATTDIDVLLPVDPEIDRRLAVLDFERKGRHFHRGPLLIEMPDSFPDERAILVDVEGPFGRTASMLSPEDALVNRLHEAVATGAFDATIQAIALLSSEDLNRERLEERAVDEGLASALAALGSLAARVDSGDEISSGEVHEIFRRLRGGAL